MQIGESISLSDSKEGSSLGPCCIDILLTRGSSDQTSLLVKVYCFSWPGLVLSYDPQLCDPQLVLSHAVPWNRVGIVSGQPALLCVADGTALHLIIGLRNVEYIMDWFKMTLGQLCTNNDEVSMPTAKEQVLIFCSSAKLQMLFFFVCLEENQPLKK